MLSLFTSIFLILFLFYFYLCVARHMPVHVTLLVEPPTTQVAGERFLSGVGHQVSLHPALVREHFPAHMTLFLSIRQMDEVFDTDSILLALVRGIVSRFSIGFVISIFIILITKIWFPTANKKKINRQHLQSLQSLKILGERFVSNNVHTYIS